MNPAYLHLVFNHFPVILPLLGILLLLWWRLRRSDDLLHAALGIFVVAALLAVPAYYSGEAAEERVEDLPGVSKPDIDEHEEAAEWAAVAIGVLGVSSGGALILAFRRRSLPGSLVAGIAVVAILTASILGRAAHLGGLIHHPEIRAPASPPAEPRQPED